MTIGVTVKSSKILINFISVIEPFTLVVGSGILFMLIIGAKSLQKPPLKTNNIV